MMPISQGYCRRTTPDRCSPVRTVELVLVERVLSVAWDMVDLADEAAAPKDAPDADFCPQAHETIGRSVGQGRSEPRSRCASTGLGQLRATTDELINHPTTD